MGFLKVLGWIFAPYVMVVIQWKRLGGAVKVFGGIWAVLCLIIFITTITSDKTKEGLEDGLVAANTVATTSETKSPNATKAPEPTVAPTKSPEPTVAPVAVKESASETSGQRNAVRKAKDYLSLTAFSKQGLIKQLTFENYSESDAEYAVDRIGADWNEQAVKTAKNYLDLTAFSKQDLITQLEFDGYTSEQAKYGVDKSYE